MALLTVPEARAALTSLTTDQLAELADVIGAAGSAMEGYCRTVLDSREVGEQVSPAATRLVRLSNRPVTAVARLASTLNAAIAVAYAGAASRATATLTTAGDPPYLTAAGLALTTTVAGVTATTTLPLGTAGGQSATLADLALAVAAVPGWTATVGAGLDGFATADLIPDLARRGAGGNGVSLWAYTADLPEWDLWPERGEVRLVGDWFPAYRHPDRTWGGTPRSGRLWCRYTAGYTDPPADLKRACVATVKAIFDLEPYPGTYTMEKVSSGNSTYSYAMAGRPDVIPPVARSILDRKYRRVSLA